MTSSLRTCISPQLSFRYLLLSSRPTFTLLLSLNSTPTQILHLCPVACAIYTSLPPSLPTTPLPFYESTRSRSFLPSVLIAFNYSHSPCLRSHTIIQPLPLLAPPCLPFNLSTLITFASQCILRANASNASRLTCSAQCSNLEETGMAIWGRLGESS